MQQHNLTCRVCGEVIQPWEPYATEPTVVDGIHCYDVRHLTCPRSVSAVERIHAAGGAIIWPDDVPAIGDGYDYVSDLDDE